MKKYFLIGILMAIVPNICFGASARFTQLAREKERKMAELEKCMGSTKGLKIAGISTLGLSAVGVAANVVEAKKIKDYDSSIESTQQQIEKTKTEINKKTDELQKKSLAGQTNDESTDNYDENIVGVAFLHNGTCQVYTENHKWNDVDEKQCSEKLSKGSWLVTKDGESITGDSMCASNGMNVPYVAPGTTNYSPVVVGEYCWCKINFGPGAYDNWILSTDAIKGTPYKCENYCAQNCAYATLNNSLSFSNTPTESKNNNNSNPKSNEGNSDNPTNSNSGSSNSNSGNNDDSTGSNTGTQAQDTTCGNLGQKECKTNYKICEKDGQTKDCTGDMLPQHATSGHCVSAGRKDYKICTATDCDDKHTLSNGHCNTQKTQENKISNQNTKTNNTTVNTDIKQLCTSNGGKIEKEISSDKIWCKIKGQCDRTQHILQQEIDAKKLNIKLNYRCKDATEGFCARGHTCEIISTAK